MEEGREGDVGHESSEAVNYHLDTTAICCFNFMLARKVESEGLKD